MLVTDKRPSNFNEGEFFYADSIKELKQMRIRYPHTALIFNEANQSFPPRPASYRTEAGRWERP